MGIVWPNGTRTEPKRSDGYGPRNPIKTSEGWTRPFHVGTDHTGIGTIKSIGDGTVVEAGWSGWAGWQVLVYLGEIDGVRTWVRYCHLASASKLKRGQKIARGQTIGTEGSTGQSMGDHLHWEIYRGRIDRGAGKNPGSTIDPRAFIKKHLTPTPREEEEMKPVAVRRGTNVLIFDFVSGVYHTFSSTNAAYRKRIAVQFNAVVQGSDVPEVTELHYTRLLEQARARSEAAEYPSKP